MRWTVCTCDSTVLLKSWQNLDKWKFTLEFSFNSPGCDSKVGAGLEVEAGTEADWLHLNQMLGTYCFGP